VVARSRQDVEGLRRAGEATGCLLQALVTRAQPGTTTGDLEAFAARYIKQLGAEPVFATENRFPGCINTSIDDEAVHGVPGPRVLRRGDLLKIDCGMRLDGYCGDATVTVAVGPVERLIPERRQVMAAANEALRLGIGAVRVGGRVGDIGDAMQSYVEGAGLRLLPQFTGHGLGRRLWEDPVIPALGRPGTGPRIEDGMVFTIEPIVVAGSTRTFAGRDGWTMRTVDGRPAAQFEHTIMATRKGPRVLTQCGPGR